MAFPGIVVPFYFQSGCCDENVPINFSADEFKKKQKSYDLQA
jgi:uncharacterized protein (DUF779 family)